MNYDMSAARMCSCSESKQKMNYINDAASSSLSRACVSVSVTCFDFTHAKYFGSYTAHA